MNPDLVDIKVLLRRGEWAVISEWSAHSPNDQALSELCSVLTVTKSGNRSR